jgi:hydroxymethylpyrimidine pyrophosphatase-like HAD family hydrolase
MSDVKNNIINIINRIQIDKNSVIVYDIDDTLLRYNGEPIKPIVDTYFYARKKGLIPVIITARIGTIENIKKTTQDLAKIGIKDYKYIYFLPPYKNDVPKFKLLARRQLHEKGYRVVISIGDNYWDIGHYGGIGFKV